MSCSEERLRLGHHAHVVVLDLRLLGDEFDGVIQRADLVHQPQFQRLFAGVHPAAGQFVDRLLEPLAADSGDVPLELGIDFVHPALDLLPLGRGEDVIEENMPAFSPRL